MHRRIWARLRRRIERRLELSFRDLRDELGSSKDLLPDSEPVAGPAVGERTRPGSGEGS